MCIENKMEKEIKAERDLRGGICRPKRFVKCETDKLSVCMESKQSE